MKKRILILLVVLLAVSAVWAESSEYKKYYFSVGLNLSKSDYIYHEESALDPIGLGGDPNKTSGIAVGAEMRLNLGLFRINITGDFSVLSPQYLGVSYLYFNGMSDIGVGIDFKNIVGIGLGLGPNMTFLFPSDGSTPWYIPGDEEEPQKQASIFYAWVHSPVNYKITLDAIVGPVMRVGIAYTFPTQFNLERFELDKLNPFLKGNIDSGKVSFYILMRVF